MIKHTSDRISQEQYLESFEVGKDTRKDALEHALDIRKFEIELYWKRATYFWTFIAAALAGYAAIQAASNISPQTRSDLTVILSCLGIVFSFAWYCANKGSKQWQENWENHVDMLEDTVVGPLYKTVLRRPGPSTRREWFERIFMGPAPYSVSKINQVVSFFVTALWILLLFKTLWPLSLSAEIDWEYISMVVLTAGACMALPCLAKTHEGDYCHVATRRKTRIGAAPPTTDAAAIKSSRN